MRVDAGRIARMYELVDGRPRTVGVVADGAVVPIESDEEIGLVVDGRRWSDADMRPADVQEDGDGRRLAWTLVGAGVTVRMVVEADVAAGVVRSRAEVSGTGRLQSIETTRWRGPAFTGFEATGEPVAYNVGPPGLGQPVFGPGFYTGIEHPVAENLVGGAGRRCACTLPLALDLDRGPRTTPAAVLGAGGLDDFWDYLDTLRAQPARVVALTNNWYHLGETGLMDDVTVAEEVRGFGQVAAEHGLVLDAVCLDDGWEGEWDEGTGLWGRMAPSRFPEGMDVAASRIGLWLSPFGGYGERRRARVAWAADHGLEVEPDGATGVLCAAGSRYSGHLARALSTWTEAGVGYWKLDGVRFSCDDPGHGHPVGPGARTAQVDSFLGLVAGIRAVRPDAVVAFTIGSHPSPWWLRSVDFVWRGGLDDTAPELPGSRLDRFDTYLDSCLHAYRLSALSVSALVTFSVVESEAASYRVVEADGGLAAWEGHCWLAVGRGTLHHDLYVSPGSLSPAEWAALSGALAWARTRQVVLARSRMVLGDPAAGEIYGYAARLGQTATVCLRNPSTRRQAVTVSWPELLGLPTDAPLTLDVRYGKAEHGAGHERLTLDPFEITLMEARSGA